MKKKDNELDFSLSKYSIDRFEEEVLERKQFQPASPFSEYESRREVRDKRIELAKADFWEFDKFYFPPEMYSEGYSDPCDFHKFLSWISQITGFAHIVLGPRKHGKTATMKKILVWLLLSERIHFSGVLSSTLPNARNILADIAELITENPRILDDFIVNVTGDNSEQFSFRLADASKTSRIMAFSEGRSVRGATKMFDRPEFILADDLETQNSAIGEEQSLKRARILSEAYNSLSANGTMVVLGNNFDERSLMNMLKVQSDEGMLSEKWQVHTFKAWDNGPLWFSRYPALSEEELRSMLGALDEAEWQADYQQNPVPPDGFIFKRHTNLPLWFELPSDVKGVLFTDPNLAKKAKGDTTAIVAYVYSPTTDYYYISNVACRSFSDPNKLLDQVLLFDDPTIIAFGWDGNVNQESHWTQHVKNWCRINQRPFKRIEYKRYHVDDLAKNIQGLWNEGRILFPASLVNTEDGKRFLQQLYAFSGKKAGKKDDGPDALISANELLHERHLGKRAGSSQKTRIIFDFFRF